MPWSDRTANIERFFTSVKPDWISLQFVPYSYHDRGIVIELGKYLRPLLQQRQLHIMFHEIWIGAHIGAILKEQLVGSVQKFFIWRLIKQLQPVVVHTSNSTYMILLRQLGITAKLLPIFGNLPVTKQTGDRWLLPRLQNLGLDIRPENRTKFWLFGFFGTLHLKWNAEPLFTYLHQAGIQHQRQIAIITIGSLGIGETLWDSLSTTYRFQFVFLKLGEQQPIKISEFFNSIDFGISTSPYLLTSKSGTTATMLEHGLPVIVNRDDFKLLVPMKLQESEPLLYKLDSQLVARINGISRGIPQSRLSSTARQFVKDLDDA